MQSKRQNTSLIFYTVTGISVACLAVLLVIVFMLMKRENVNNSSSSAPSEAVSEQTESVGQESKTASVVSTVSGDSETSSVSSQNSETTSKTSTVSKTHSAVPFEQNSIDSSLEKQMNNAGTIAEVVNIYNVQIDAWKKKIAAMVTKLTATNANYQTEQTKWEKEAATTIAQIEAKYQDVDGSQAQLATAAEIYELYRGRAEQLYNTLIKLQPDFTL